MNLELTGLTGIFGITAAFLFGTWTPLATALLVVIALDIITGIAKGIYNKKLRSRNMAHGMLRKGGIFIVIIIANMIDLAMFNTVPVCASCTILFYIGQEGLSVLENLALMKVKLPGFIKDHLLVLKEKAEKDGKGEK